MHIEQIIELGRPLVVHHTCTPKTGYFHDNAKISFCKYLSDYLMLKILLEQLPCFSHLGQVTYKI